MMRGIASPHVRLPLLLILLVAGPLSAQQSEKRVSWTDEEARSSWPVRIAVSPGGASFVTWENGSRLLALDGSFAADVIPYSAWYGGVFAVEEDRWAFMRAKDSIWTDSIRGWHFLRIFFYELRDFRTFLENSDTIFTATSWRNGDLPPTTEGRDTHPGRISYTQTSNGILSGTVLSTRRQAGIVYYLSIDPIWTFWPFDRNARPYSFPGRDITFKPAFDQIVTGATQSGVPFILYRRHTKEGLDEYSTCRLNPVTGAVDATVILDTLPGTLEDEVTTFIPHDDGSTEFIAFVPGTDTLSVRSYDAGGKLRFAKILSVNMHRYGNCPDVSHVRLRDGQHVLAWSRVDSPNRTRAYIVLFDQSWERVGVPRRISPVETAEQSTPGLSLRNDTIAVAWLDTRDSLPSVYYKRIAIADLASRPPPVYVVPFSRIEDSIPRADLTDPLARDQYVTARDAILGMAGMMHAQGLQWSVQPDAKFLLAALRFEPELNSSATNGKNLFRYLKEDLDIAIDPYSREESGYNYTDVAALLDSLGAGGSRVIGAHIWDPSDPDFQIWDRYWLPIRGTAFPDAIWRAKILTGSTTKDHRGEPLVSGVWRPMGRWHYFIDDKASPLSCIGQYTNDLPGIVQLVSYRQRRALHPDSILTAGYHIRFDMIADAAARSAVADTVLEVLARMRDEGEIIVTDFTSLIAQWRMDYGAEANIYRPGISTLDADRPAGISGFSLSAGFPNPASATATFRVTVPLSAPVRLTIHDVLGRIVAAPVDRLAEAGSHSIRIDVGTLPSGIYIARMHASGEVHSTRFVVTH
jgi:hypothetical protein